MNRNQLPGQLEAKLDRLGDDEKCAVLVININRFKQINDTLGHAYGDILLCRAADRLKDLCGEDYLCARFGGDEFAVVLSGTNALDMAIHFADVVADEFSKPFVLPPVWLGYPFLKEILLLLDKNNLYKFFIKFSLKFMKIGWYFFYSGINFIDEPD